MQAFDRCCSGGAIVPASYGSWFIVFRARVLQAALIGVAQWVEHQAVNLTVTGSTPVDATKLAQNQPDPGRGCVLQKLAGNACLARSAVVG